MTVPNLNLYQYCPFCGGDLGFLEVCHFCPHCGKRLHKKENKDKKKNRNIQGTPRKPAKEAAQSLDATLVSNDGVLADRFLTGSVSDTALLPALPDENHTVVLKFCPDRERLFIRLTEFLRRDSFAIRLAVEMIPSVLMYKSKLVEVLPVIQACRVEGALLSVVSGPFTMTVDFPPAILEELSANEQDIIKNSPPALWLGETIHFAVGKVVANGIQGLLVLSNHHLYFVGLGSKGFEYTMLSLETIVGVECSERKKSTTLIVQQQGQAIENFYVTAKHRPIAKLYQLLQTVVAARQVRR